MLAVLLKIVWLHLLADLRAGRGGWPLKYSNPAAVCPSRVARIAGRRDNAADPVRACVRSDAVRPPLTYRRMLGAS
jgi:hypothetical protein